MLSYLFKLKHILPVTLRLRLGTIPLIKLVVKRFITAEKRTHKRKVVYLNRQQQNETINSETKISIVMSVYNTDPKYLSEAIQSVIAQSYPHWELCITDDGSTREETLTTLTHFAECKNIYVQFSETNEHISRATNQAIETASGSYIGFLDHDDKLHSHALMEVAYQILRNPKAEILFTDEDKINARNEHYDEHFKSDWNKTLFYSQNYLSHLTVIKRLTVNKVGNLRPGYEGSQDFDLLLRCIEVIDETNIIHIPKVLYHWRAIEGSTALNTDQKDYASEAGLKALNSHFVAIGEARIAIPGPVPTTYLNKLIDPDSYSPSVAIIIPTKNQHTLLQQCIDSILNNTDYRDYRIYIVNNGSDDCATLALFERYKQKTKIEIIDDSRPFNYSQLNNNAISFVEEELALLLNNDTEVIDRDWLANMVDAIEPKDVGIVGAKLLYPDASVQHAGVILGIGGVAGHSHKYFPANSYGYFSRLVLPQQMSAVTGACLLIKRSVYSKLGGLDETNLSVAFNDVDLCLRVVESGLKVVWTPLAKLYHHESISRGKEDSPEKQQRFATEVQYMLDRWSEELSSDPYYNPNLTLHKEDFSHK